MAGRGILTLNGTMCQHDFEGKRLFQHRNHLKWSLVRNPHVPGFVFETECNNYLLKLKPLDRVIAHCPPLDADLAKPIAGRAATYHRVKHDQRPMSFDPDGRIGQGTARLERFWNIRLEGDSAVLEIFGENGITARLVEHPQGSGLWQGRWLKHERMEVHIHFEQ